MQDEATVIHLHPNDVEPLPKERCALCRFWKQDDSIQDGNDRDWGFGFCRLRPPVVIDCLLDAQIPLPAYGDQTDLNVGTLELLTASVFPVTHSLDWCGDFRVKSGAEPVTV